MSIYKYAEYLTSSTDSAFDATHNPGNKAPYSGIYRCQGCGREVASNEGEPLPPQNHHQHPAPQGAVRWKLVVFANHKAA